MEEPTLFGFPIKFTDKEWPQPKPPEPDDTPSWFCGCGLMYEGPDKKQVLCDILNVFTEKAGPLLKRPYVNAEKRDELYKKYTPGAIDLIAYFLDHLGYMNHSSCVMNSQWLTEEGIKLRKWANG